MAYSTKRYRAEHDGHRVEVDFDPSLVVLNRVTLLIDGKRSDTRSLFYGSTRLYGDLPGDGSRQ